MPSIACRPKARARSGNPVCLSLGQVFPTDSPDGRLWALVIRTAPLFLPCCNLGALLTTHHPHSSSTVLALASSLNFNIPSTIGTILTPRASYNPDSLSQGCLDAPGLLRPTSLP